MQLNYNNEIITKSRNKLISRADKYKFSVSQKFIIENAELPTDKLTIVFNYINYNNSLGLDKENIAVEVKRCLELYNPVNEKNISLSNNNMYLRSILPEYEKDTLFGSDKKRILANITFMNFNNRDMLIRNLFMLINSNYPSKIITLIMKALILTDESFRYTIPFDLEHLKKDLILNKVDSFFFKSIVRQYSIDNYESIENIIKNNQNLIEEGLVFQFFLNIAKVETYEWSDKEVYCIDSEKLAEWLNDKNIFIHALQKKYPEYKTDIDKEKYSALTQIVPETNIILKIPSNSIKQYASQGTVNVTMGHYENTMIQCYNDEYQYTTGGYCNKLEFLIFHNNTFIEKLNKKEKDKYIPLQLKKIHWFYHMSNIFKNFFDYMFTILEEKYPIVKDLKREMIKDRWHLPISINELLLFSNKNELFKTKYKVANELKINFNKLSFNMAYIIVKTYPYLDDMSKGILQNIKDESLFELTDWKYKNNIMQFISNYYEKKGITDYILIKDYINMCMLAGKKISLRFNSITKIKEAHDQVALYAQKKGTGKVKAPKNSRFNILRKILPKEFEWIKSRKRLMQEANMQHHCVWSYAEDITSDRCAIYSYLDSTGQYTDDWKGIPERYTIEFIIASNGYRVNQIQGTRNQKTTIKINDYISSFSHNNLI